MKNFNIKKGWAVARLNFKSLIPISLILLAIFTVFSIPQIILNLVGGSVETLGFSTWFYTFAMVIPVFLATTNFNKTMRLGAKKKDYFVGVLIMLALLAAAISLISIITYYAIDKPITDNLADFYSLYDVLGFKVNGIIVGFMQQFGFVFLFSVLVFLFTGMQDNWKGWIVDGGIAVFVATTMSIGVLREYIWQKGILYLAITGHPLAQICFTIFGGVALYFLYLTILKRKKI